MALGQHRVHLWTNRFLDATGEEFFILQIFPISKSCSLETIVVFGVNRQVMNKTHLHY